MILCAFWTMQTKYTKEKSIYILKRKVGHEKPKAQSAQCCSLKKKQKTHIILQRSVLHSIAFCNGPTLTLDKRFMQFRLFFTGVFQNSLVWKQRNLIFLYQIIDYQISTESYVAFRVKALFVSC